MTFHVHLPGDRQFEAEPGETLLAAGRRQNLALPFGCQSGSCGSCRVRLVRGRVEPPGRPGPGLPPALVDAGYILMCQSQPRSDVEIALHQPEAVDQCRPRRVTARLAGKQELSRDVLGLTVKLPHGRPFRFLPGQYVDFILEDGRRRSFSIAAHDEGNRTLEFHLRVAAGGHFASQVRDQMPVRSLLQFEGPLGAFYLRDSDHLALMVAGGTGFAPMKAMLQHVFRSGAPRPLHLFWGAATLDGLYSHEAVSAWQASHPNFRYTPVLTDPPAGWSGATGLVHEAALQAYPAPQDVDAYLAGPPAMVHAAMQALPQAGLDPDRLFYDSFDYAHETWPGVG